MAAVFCASLSRRAMVCRRRVIFTRSSRAASSAATGERGMETGSCTGAAAGTGLASARSTSSFMIRPSRPVPSTWSGERPRSAMSLLAEGAFSTSRFTAGAGAASAAAAPAAATGAAAAAPAAPPAMRPSLPPAFTVAPASA